MVKGKRKKVEIAAEPAAHALALGQLHAQVAKLQGDRQWLLKQIRRKRTELDNFMTQMRTIVTEMMGRGAQFMERVQTLDEEIHQLFNQILTTRKLGKKSRGKIEDLYRSLQYQDIISDRPLPGEEDDEDNDFATFVEEMKKQAQEAYSRGESPSESEETDINSRDMRQTFLRLAAIYHPDRATDQDTQAQNTEIMKEINRAYKDGDFARLLELEQQTLNEMVETLESSDDLEKACAKLKRENQKLRDQYEGIKRELRHLRNNTHEGNMVKSYRQAQKIGLDMFAQMEQEAEMEVENMTRVRDFVQNFRDQKITVQEFLRGPEPQRVMVVYRSNGERVVIPIHPDVEDFF
ncbi:MAG: hypothetical protein EA366_16095 [Spirulina sp. DLM2.Bin59]|nr:MAG: hypothetical protein EA366_16095 [Spirulina sp. DLM2.Bin59]